MGNNPNIGKQFKNVGEEKPSDHQLQLFLHPNDLKSMGSGDHPKLSAYDAAMSKTEPERITQILRTGKDVHNPVVVGFHEGVPTLFEGHHRAAVAIHTGGYLPVEYTHHTDPWDYAEESVLGSAK